MSYHHLSQNDRYQIYALKRAGLTITQIANELSRCASTISRELARGAGARGYRPDQAQRLAQERAEGSRNARRIASVVWDQVRLSLAQQHSPEQIAAHQPVSHESIYGYVYADKRSGGSLWRELRCQKLRKKRYASGRSKRGRIPNRRDIASRPNIVERRARFGDWEADTIIGARHHQAIVSLSERKSGLTLLRKVSAKTSAAVSRAITAMLAPYKGLVHTITFDNGLEFAEHEHIDQALGSTSYFAKPYCSWQRGSNENTNGLVRQYIPKSRPLSDVTDQQIQFIENRLNTRPRKRLNFKAPLQAISKPMRRVALRA
jgi:transposase, IS30 family